MRILHIVFALAMGTACCFGSEINCSYPRNGFERVVCSDPELVRLHTEIESLVRKLISSDPSMRWKLEQGQSIWEQGSPFCTGPSAVECMKGKFSKRIAVLHAWANGDKPVPASAVDDKVQELREQQVERERHAEAFMQAESVEREKLFDSEQQIKQLRIERANLENEINRFPEPGEKPKPWVMPERDQVRVGARRASKYSPQAREHEIDENAAKFTKLQNQVSALLEEPRRRQSKAIEDGVGTLKQMQALAASPESRAASGPIADAVSELKDDCDQLSKAINKGDAKMAFRLTNGLRDFARQIETKRKLFDEYTTWESRQTRFAASTGPELSVQGIHLGSTFPEVRKTLLNTCGDLASVAKSRTTASAALWDTRKQFWRYLIEDNLELGFDSCLTIAGEKRPTRLYFAPPADEERKLYDSMLEAGE